METAIADYFNLLLLVPGYNYFILSFSFAQIYGTKRLLSFFFFFLPFDYYKYFIMCILFQMDAWDIANSFKRVRKVWWTCSKQIVKKITYLKQLKVIVIIYLKQLKLIMIIYLKELKVIVEHVIKKLELRMFLMDLKERFSAQAR